MLLAAVCLGSALLLTAAWGGQENEGHEAEHARELRQAGKILPLERILAGAREQFPHARLVEVELLERPEGHVYEVELIDAGGTFRELFYDARTGRPLPRETGD